MSLSSENQSVIKKVQTYKVQNSTNVHSDPNQNNSEECIEIKEELIDIDESTLDAEETLLMNETIEQDDEDTIYKCNICDATFVHSSAYKRHYTTHTRDIYECNICHKSFLQENHLKMHMESHMTKQQTYHCEICHKKFPSVDDHTLHMKEHNNERPFECEICHRSFVRKSHLQRHVKIHSSNMPLFKCQICHKTYTQESSLKQHISKHGAYYEYECEVCHIKFIRLMDHVAHMKIHNEESITQTDAESITSYEKLNPEVIIKQEWSKEATCMLIELFRERRELWDSGHEGFKNRRLKNEAWSDISRIMNLSKSEIEKKTRCLVGQFQRERRKYKTFSEVDDEKEPRWFGYHLLSFLENRNKRGESVGEQTQQSTDESFEQEQNYSDSPLNLEIPNKRTTSSNQNPTYENPLTNDNNTTDTYSHVLRSLYNKISRDEYDIFGESIACNIRNLKTSYAKSTVKYHINNILYQAELGHYDQPPCFGKNSTVSNVNRASESIVSHEASTQDELDNMLNEL